MQEGFNRVKQLMGEILNESIQLTTKEKEWYNSKHNKEIAALAIAITKEYYTPNDTDLRELGIYTESKIETLKDFEQELQRIYYPSLQDKIKSKLTKRSVGIIVVITVIVLVSGGCILLNPCIFGHKYTSPTCIDAAKCLKCGKIGEPALGHDFADPTCADAAKCKRCGEINGEPLGHNVEQYKIITAPTCTQTGDEVGICTVCGEELHNSLEKTAHTPGNWEIETVATYSENGKKVQKCTVCGEVINTDSYSLSQAEKTQWLKNNCTLLDYDAVARNPQIYKNQRKKFGGRVIQAIQENEGYTLRIAYANDYSRIMYVVFLVDTKANQRILEGDYLNVYGIFNGDYTYTAALGNQVTIPSFIAEYIEWANS